MLITDCWLEETHKLLKIHVKKRPLKQIAEDTGLKLGWLADFSTMRCKNHRILHVQTLYKYLQDIHID